MKYILILLCIFVAGCSKDETVEIADSYFGSVSFTYEITQLPDTTIHNVTVEVHRASDDSLFIMQRIPYSVPVGTVEDTMLFGARITESGNITIPPYNSAASGNPVITGSGEISGDNLAYTATETRNGIIIHYSFTGTAQ